MADTPTAPSIFNDAVGPIMRGPSSSHCAAAHRIGRLCLDLMGGEITALIADYDINGALCTTHMGQGTDMGLYSGILGYEVHDERIQQFDRGIAEKGISVSVNYLDYGATHPNNYRLTLRNEAETHVVEAISLGGGMIEIQKIDHVPVSIAGDYYELVVFHDSSPEPIRKYLSDNFHCEGIFCHEHSSRKIIRALSCADFDANKLDGLQEIEGVLLARVLKPVLPILSRKDLNLPFRNAQEMLQYSQTRDLALWELAVEYESIRGNITKSDVFEKMRDIAKLMKKSIELGIHGTEFDDRILPAQAPKLKQAIDANRVPDDIVNRMSLYTTAMMDVKSSMGLIVAAPTAGSCGTLPGAIFGAASFLDKNEDEIVKALLAAGMIGVFISGQATFAAEVAGCMAETGAAGSMAAAGLVHLLGGNLDQGLGAAARTLGASLGLICDMVGDRVEVPCLDKNIAAASKAYANATSAIASFTQVIPLDEVIDSMREVGEMMPRELCCTGLGGLATTPTGIIILQKLTDTDDFGQAKANFYKHC